MIKRAVLLFACLALVGFAAGGCGDEGGDGGGGGDAPSGESSNGGSGSDAVPEVSTPSVKQAVENCRRSVDEAPQLSEDLKSDLEDICEKAARGDEDAVRKATKGVCERIIEESVPAGAARDQALQACEQAQGSP
jgi:hypothetical protein